MADEEFCRLSCPERGRLLRSSLFARDLHSQLTRWLRECKSISELNDWVDAYKEHIRALPLRNSEQFLEEIEQRREELR